MGQLKLTAGLLTGHQEIDAEHRQLIDLANECIASVETGLTEACAENFERLREALDIHFEHEERSMEELAYRNLADHEKTHIEVKRKIGQLAIKCVDDGFYGEEFIKEMIEIILVDLVKADMDFKSYLMEINYRG